MDSIRRAGACASVLLLLSVAGAAAEPAADATAPWTLDYCIQTAFEKHGDVLVAEQNIEAARAQHRSAGSSLFWPTISARSTRTEGDRGQAGGTTVQRVGKTSDEQHLLSGSITLWDGGTAAEPASGPRRGDLGGDGPAPRPADDCLERHLRLHPASACPAYPGGDRAEDEADRRAEEDGAGAHRGGDAADVDIYPIEAQLASARVEQVRAASDVRVAGSALRNAMGLEGGAVPTVAELPAEWPEVPSLEECRRLAHEARPELAQSLASIERERASVSLSKLRLLPQLTSSARWDRGLGGSSIVSQWSINAGVSWSFFNRGDRADVDAAKASLRATEEQHQRS